MKHLKSYSQLITEQRVIPLTDTKFDILVKHSDERLTIIDFTASWCGPCQRMKKHIDEIMSDISYKYALQLGVYDLEANGNFDSPLVKRFGINGIPYMMFYKKGKLVHSFSGYKDKAQLLAIIDKYKF
jgi:thioredoxin 1